MTEILNEEEINYLKSLGKSSVWISILTKLSIYQAPPLFTPASTNQYDRWVYESGYLKGVKGMISLLNVMETPIILKEDK